MEAVIKIFIGLLAIIVVGFVVILAALIPLPIITAVATLYIGYLLGSIIYEALNINRRK